MNMFQVFADVKQYLLHIDYQSIPSDKSMCLG